MAGQKPTSEFNRKGQVSKCSADTLVREKMAAAREFGGGISDTRSGKTNCKSNGSGQECPLYTSRLYAPAADAANCGA